MLLIDDVWIVGLVNQRLWIICVCQFSNGLFIGGDFVNCGGSIGIDIGEHFLFKGFHLY